MHDRKTLNIGNYSFGSDPQLVVPHFPVFPLPPRRSSPQDPDPGEDMGGRGQGQDDVHGEAKLAITLNDILQQGGVSQGKRIHGLLVKKPSKYDL